MEGARLAFLAGLVVGRRRIRWLAGAVRKIPQDLAKVSHKDRLIDTAGERS